MTPDSGAGSPNPPLNEEERTRLNEKAEAASKEVRDRQAQRGQADQETTQGNSAQKPEQEVSREREAQMKGLVNTDEFKRKVQAERDERFKREVGLFIAQSSPSQRAILQDELDKASGKVQPVAVRDLHAELHANEAAKIDKAAADVATRQAPLPPPGVASRPDVLDQSQYEKLDGQWRMCLGMSGGHMAYRWLSMAEAQSLGLEKTDPVPSDADLGAVGVGSGSIGYGAGVPGEPGPHGVPESEGYIVSGSGRRVPIPKEHHAGVRGVSERIEDLGKWPDDPRLDVDQKKEPGA